MHHKLAFSSLRVSLLLFFILFLFLFLFVSLPHGDKQPAPEISILQLDHDRCRFKFSETRSRDHCPSYFSWIRHDLAPWKETGITHDNLVKDMADFRLVIVDGKLYMERYRFCYQTRAQYTLWGILMLLEKFPGQVPDLELMFSCGDRPNVLKKNYCNTSGSPPAVFAYCTTTNSHYDIVFPDWSFWGWPEVNIAPWSVEMEKIVSEARKVEWRDRLPVVQWKGNTFMGKVRPRLVQCSKSRSSRLLVNHQDWETEVKNNFSSSSLSAQCLYRYKVYVEGIGWSVSLKYILACGSPTLRIEPKYFEFFSRSLVPYLHFWPVGGVRDPDMCDSIQSMTKWGNEHPLEVEKIGACGVKFLEEEVTMEYVYQYMLHLLQGYAKLLKFKPVPPPGIEAMSLQSDLLWHEVTMPKARRRQTICSL